MVLTACVSNKPAPPTYDNVHIGTDKVFEFKKMDANGQAISGTQIAQAIASNMSSLSGFGPVRNIYKGTSIYNVKGVKVQYTPSHISFTYVNGEYFSKTKGKYLTQKTAVFKYTVTNTADTIKLKISPPSQIRTDKKSLILTRRANPPLLSKDRMIQNLSKIFNNLNPVLNRYKRIKGEINVKYNDESVYANFKRIMGEYKYKRNEVKKFDIKKDSVFNLKNGDKIIPLKTAVFPYRNGSKVVYEFDVRYQLKGDGSSSYSASNVQGLISKIENVAKN